jgi:hypothetical protein
MIFHQLHERRKTIKPTAKPLQTGFSNGNHKPAGGTVEANFSLESPSNKLNSSGMTHFSDKECGGRESESVLPDISRKCFDINYKPFGKGLVMTSLNINSL